MTEREPAGPRKLATGGCSVSPVAAADSSMARTASAAASVSGRAALCGSASADSSGTSDRDRISSARRRKPSSVKQRKTRPVGLLHAGRFPIDRDGKLRVELDELAADAGLVGERFEVFTELGPALGRVGPGEALFERLELRQQGRGFFRPDEGDAGDVVDAVADEGLKIDDLVGADAPFLFERVCVVVRVFADVVNLHARLQELADVFVVGDDPHLEAAFGCLSHEGGDDVVGLPTGIGNDRSSEGLDHLHDDRDLGGQIDGDFAAVGLIGGISVIPHPRPWGVEGTNDVRGLFLRADELQVASETEDGVGRLAVGAGHLGYGVKHLEDEGKRINDVQQVIHANSSLTCPFSPVNS